MKHMVTLAMLAITMLGSQVIHAQEISPIAGRCTVAPMPWDHIMQLVDQAAASPVSDVKPTPVSTLSGSPVNETDLAALSEVIDQMQFCSQEQDLPRLLSLYTDRLIVEQFFADEPITIVVTELSTPTQATPAPIMPDQQQFIMEAVVLPDGRIAAKVSGNAWGGDPQLYYFVEEDGRWLIDEIAPVTSDASLGGVAGVTIPADAQTVVDLVLADAAQQLGVDRSKVTITAIEAVEWPDSALGCPEEGGVYAQVISPGYRITVTESAQTLDYHTGLNNAFVNCQG